jgi:dTDP-D-glucose 4,6-dehydratase
MSTTKANRPTFFYNGQPVRAAGLLIYVTDHGESSYLLRSEKKGRWSDIGGKTDATDADILTTVVREVTEETNNHLFAGHHTFKQASERLDHLLRNEELEIFYCPRGKYILVKVHFDLTVKQMDMKRFGLREHEAMNHYYAWVKNIQRHKLHPRLRFHTEYNNIF